MYWVRYCDQDNNKMCVTHKHKVGEGVPAIYNEHEHSGVWLCSEKVVSTISSLITCKLN